MCATVSAASIQYVFQLLCRDLPSTQTRAYDVTIQSQSTLQTECFDRKVQRMPSLPVVTADITGSLKQCYWTGGPHRLGLGSSINLAIGSSAEQYFKLDG